jgi:hypothetical protein
MSQGIWNPARTSYARSKGLGHFDGIDAVKYLCRHANLRSNPTPALPPGVTSQTHHIPESYLRPEGRVSSVTEIASRAQLADLVRRKRR